MANENGLRNTDKRVLVSLDVLLAMPERPITQAQIAAHAMIGVRTVPHCLRRLELAGMLIVWSEPGLASVYALTATGKTALDAYRN